MDLGKELHIGFVEYGGSNLKQNSPPFRSISQNLGDEIHEMKTRRRKLIGLFILCLLACDATFSVGYPTATSAPPTGTATVTPPSLKLTLTSIPYNENNQSPPSTITALIPQLTGSDDPRVTSFNEAVNLLLAAEIESFRLDWSACLTRPRLP